jgi:hypothetical protein
MRWLCLLFLLAFVATAAPGVDAALCKTRKGAVFVHDACKRKEVALDPAAIGAAGPKGDPGPPGSTQPRLRAVDANGQRLPGFVTARGRLVYPVGSRTVAFTIRVSDFIGEAFVFEAMNCAGPRLVSVYGDLSSPAAFIGTTAYYGGDPVQDHPVQSTLVPTAAQNCMGPGQTYDPVNGLCCSNNAAFSTTAGPATPIDLGGFAPPFRLELEE